jgi:hypothetical protein
MANNPGSRNWNDFQMALATMAMALTLGLWNVFAEPDRTLAKESAAQSITPPPEVAPAVNPAPTQLGPIKIMLGGTAPQTTVVVQQSGRGRNNGGGGGGGPTTNTHSS